MHAVASVLLAKEVCNGSVIVCCMLKRFERTHLPALLRHLPLPQLLQELWIVIRIAQNSHPRVVLRSGSDERYTTDIDFLNGFGYCDVDLRDGILEGV